ncbi:MAG: hypothetical protein H7644_13975 [Candidatus Heimdallarchaeota archaeon]|nr:hypothetical protein [Candidatus Heimdallarchaeota archaeon]MCK5144868.1 hypothetical protein [Candidatus Heimdallarchaeota archaeon]
MSEKQVLLELWDVIWNVPYNAPMVNARKMNKVYLIVAKALEKKPVIHKSFEQIEKEGKKKKKKNTG